MSEWKQYRFDEVANIVDCEHKTAPTIEKSDFYSVRTSNISQGKIDFDNCIRVGEDVYIQWIKRATPEQGDIILAREAPVGEVGMVKDGYKVCLGQRTVLIKVTSSEINNQYLLYHLVNPANKNELIEMSGGSVVAHLNMKDIRAYEFEVPPLHEQKAIAEVLSSLDDKLDLLHRQNKTLEQMAETLFRQWFVVEAEESWEEGVLSDLIIVKYGKDHKKISDGNIPVLGSGGLMRYADTALYEKESVLIPRKGSLNNVMYMNEPFWTVDTMFYTEMKKSNIAKFIYHFVKELDLASMNVGSAVPSMTTEVLNNMSIEIPSDAFLQKFEETIEPMYLKIKSNQTQIRTLEKMRDTLLPKLMNGEVRVMVN